jgi:hypothetical protein
MNLAQTIIHRCFVKSDLMLMFAETDDMRKRGLQSPDKRGDEFVTVSLDYRGGMRYAHLERVETTPNLLDAILAPAK